MTRHEQNPADMSVPQNMEDDDHIHLTRRESLRLLDLIENPPSRNERFRQAMERYRRLTATVEPTQHPDVTRRDLPVNRDGATEQKAERDRLTQEALADVDAGRVIDHQAVQAWAESLGADRPRPRRQR